MTKQQYIERISELVTDDNKVERVEKVYGTQIPNVLKGIISNCDEPVFFDDDYRILSLDEIVDAENDLHVDFKIKGIIPIVDCGENDFIVYLYNENIWAMFNIIDEIVYNKKESLDELLLNI